MHIVVCVKQVPDATQVRIDPVTNTLDRSSAPAIINPYDAHAVEEAVAVKRKVGGKVSVICMGPLQAKDVIKKCIELGADAGYLLSDRAFAGSDTLATSYILSAGIQKIAEKSPVDLIICGKQAIDGDTAQVGPGIARRMGMAQLTYVQKIASVHDHEIVVHRKIDGGYEVVQCKLPCLLTVEKEINDLSYSSMPDMIRAARYEPQVWNVNAFETDPAQMGLNGSPTTVRKIFAPPERLCGERLQGTPDEMVKNLVNKLVEKLS